MCIVENLHVISTIFLIASYVLYLSELIMNLRYEERLSGITLGILQNLFKLQLVMKLGTLFQENLPSDWSFNPQNLSIQDENELITATKPKIIKQRKDYCVFLIASHQNKIPREIMIIQKSTEPYGMKLKQQ